MIGIVTLEPDSVNSTLEQNYQKFQVKKNGPKKKWYDEQALDSSDELRLWVPSSCITAKKHA